MKDCVFCKISKGKIPVNKIWEDENHIAFLSNKPNTKGFTVVITKKHFSSYAFNLSDSVLSELVIASKKVALLLDKKLEDVGRTGLILEGFGVDHVHSKLFPMHGTKNMKGWQPIHSNINKYFKKYERYISSHDCRFADNKELELLAKQIRSE